MENKDETTPALLLEEGEISDSDEKREEREEPIPNLVLTSRHPKVEHTSSRKVFTSIFQRLEREGRVEELPR